MKNRRCMLCVAFACAAHAAGAADPADCIRIVDNAARLACYDEAFNREEIESSDDPYTPVDFRELWVNFRGHVGKKIQVEGEISNLAEPDFVTFATRLPAANTIRVQIAQLPQQVRARISESCRRSCKVIVKGVASARGQNQIVADDIEFRTEGSAR